MNKFENLEYSFNDIYTILTKCNKYDLAYFVCRPYVMKEITDTTIDYRSYYKFTSDGLYVIRTDKSDNIIELFSFDYSDLNISEKYKLWEYIEFCEPEKRLDKVKSFVRK